MQDWRGNEIEVGDIVAYPRVSGRSAEIVEAKVLEFSSVKSGYSAGDPVVYVEALRSSRFRFGTEHPERWWPDRGKRVRLNILNNLTLLEKVS